MTVSLLSFRSGRLRRLLAPVVTFTLALGTTVAPVAQAKEQPTANAQVVFEAWDSATDFAHGTHQGTAVVGEDLVLATPAQQRDYTDVHATPADTRTYDQASWLSPEVSPGFPLTELVASWNADAPEGTWIEVEVAGTADDGTRSKWYVLGRWAEHDREFHSTSAPGQGDDLATVAIDTLVTRTDRTLSSYQLRVSLMRRPGTSLTPRVSLVGVMASAVPERKKVPVSVPGAASGTVLDVPTYSQEVHIGHYPQWDGGGEAWCSPTSTAMVLAYWDRGPTPDDYSWVEGGHQDPWVDHAARYTYDYNYDGAGNWPFNTAYAARYGLESFVTRLRSLSEAERFISAGIPLVVSMSFKKNELDGAGYGTNGHLLTIVGFAENGDVVVNDPASHLLPDNDQVRTTYDRAQFENAWITSTGGLSYVIHPADVPLPQAGEQPNW